MFFYGYICGNINISFVYYVMEEDAKKLYNIIKDYRNDDGISINEQHIIDWANQFGEDNEFMLKEITHIMPKVYVSKKQAKIFIRRHIEALMKEYNYTNIQNFLMDVEFLDLQLPHKSQPAILKLLEEILTEDFQESYAKYETFPKIIYIYFDDILASGSTIGKDIIDWLNTVDAKGIPNITNILNDKYKLSINLFCLHTWGHAFLKFRLKKTFEDKIGDKILWRYNYEIQNHAKWNNQSLNIAFPVEEQEPNIKKYLAGLAAEKYEDYAYRKASTPQNEGFFSSPENRIRYENVLLQKGLSIIGMIQGEVKANIRPLGLIHPNYKTFGLGTHFFTWRNIPNNSPLVFWWEVNGHKWKPLFSVANRGL